MSGVDVDADRKAWSTLVALAALRGYGLWRTDAGDGPQRFVLARWGVARMCATRREVEDFLDLVETAR